VIPVRRGRGPQASSPVLRAMAVLAVVAGLALLIAGMSGCSTAKPAESPKDLAQTLAAAEKASTAGGDSSAPSPQKPASFISLCANCHDRLDVPLDWRTKRKLIFNHEAHFAKGIRCAACHQEFPHKPGKTLHVPVETCFQCHGSQHGAQGVMAPTSCDTCHTPDIATSTPDHAKPNWLLASGNGLALHSQQATQRRLYCKMCHPDSFCNDCHKVEMPHPDDWVKTAHQTVVKTDGRASCARCHPEQNFCNNCHHKSFPVLADWGMQHKAVVEAGGAEACYVCHQETFCSACHVRVGKQRGTLGA
jgi:Cytochrome c7 and related cytochrome c